MGFRSCVAGLILISVMAVRAQTIPRTNWVLLRWDSQEIVAEDGAASNILDGSTTTIWHTQYDGATPPYPHYLDIDLGESFNVSGIRYLPRQNGCANGWIKNFSLYASADGVNWDAAPFFSGSFTYTGSTTCPGATVPPAQEITFPSQSTRYIRFFATSEVNGNPWASGAELNFLGSPTAASLAPNGTITSPASNVTILAGQSVDFLGSGTDPDNNLPLTYHWTFGAGSGIADSTAQNPGSLQFNTPGTYVVTFTVTDATGVSDPTPASRTITVSDGSTGTPADKSIWKLVYVDSQETVWENTPATQSFDSNSSTIWHTQYYNGVAPLPHEVQINLGQSYLINGLGYLPRQDGCANGWIKNYEIYVSDDVTNWGAPVASGSFDYTGAVATCPGASVLSERTVSFPQKRGQFIRLRALSEVNGNQFTSAAEIDAMVVPGSGDLPPNGSIDQPTTDISINVGDTVAFAGSASDPDANLPLSYDWNFGGAGIADSTLQNPGTLQFNTAGVFTVSLTVSDSLGVPDPTPAQRKITVINPSSAPISKAGWTLRYVDSEETLSESAPATDGFDADSATFWHTQWHSPVAPYPHEIQIDLGAFYTLDAFGYLPRQDGCSHGWIKDYEFYISDDGVNWGAPVKKGTFDYGGASLLCPGASAVSERNIALPSVTGRYVRLRALSEVNGNPWASMAELNLYGMLPTGNLPPSGEIISPASDLTINTGESVSFAGTATDPDNNLPLTYDWDFGAGSGIANSTEQNPGSVMFNTPGVFTITFTATDSLGLADPTPATRTITVLDPSFSQPISQAEWKVRFVDSQETPDAEGFAYRAFDGDPTTYWHSRWSLATDPLPHEVQIDLANTYTITSLGYLPRQDGCSNGWIKNYEVYVSSDGMNWGTPVATGAFDYTGFTAVCGGGASKVPVRVVNFPATTGRYLRLRALTEVNGNPWTSAAEITLTGKLVGSRIPRGGWTTTADSQEATNPAALAEDGDVASFWSSAFSGGIAPLPHQLDTNLGETYNLAGFLYTPRQDLCANGWISNYEFYVSPDGTNWGPAVAAGQFDYGLLAHSCPGASQPEAQFVQTATTTGQYARLRALSEVNGAQYTSAAELNIFRCETTPSVSIVRPQLYDLTSSGNLRVTALACLDPVNQAGWGVRIMVDGGTASGGSQVDVTSAPFETVFSSVPYGEHTVDVYMIDSNGTIVSGSSAHDQVTHVAVGDYYVAMGDSVTMSWCCDDLRTDNISPDGRTTGEGYPPYLSGLLTSALGRPVTVVNEGVSGAISADGVKLVSALVARHREAQMFLVMYGTNDSRLNVPSGLGLNPGDPGYAGTYKANLQAIIDAVKAAGKNIAFAKPPILLAPVPFGTPYTDPSTAAPNLLIQQYNQVIDELRTANGIGVVAPDFYNYFGAHPDQYFDYVHPNGIGFESMGNLWLQALSAK